MRMPAKNVWVVLVVLASVSIAALVVGLGKKTEELSEPVELVEPTPPTPPVIIKVDGVNCVIAEVPVLTYYVASDSVRVTIECDSDILWHYLPASEEKDTTL